jgi:hypothetical protein
MTARELQREIAHEQRRLSDLARDVEVAEGWYRAEASKPKVGYGPLSERFNERSVHHAREHLARLRATQETTQLRIETFTMQLPTADVVTHAAGEADRLMKQVLERDACVADLWKGFMLAVDAVEAAARKLTAVRRPQRQIRREVSELITRYGLDLSIPPSPEPDPYEIQIVQTVAALARHVITSDAIDPMLEKTLQRSHRAKGVISE